MKRRQLYPLTTGRQARRGPRPARISLTANSSPRRAEFFAPPRHGPTASWATPAPSFSPYCSLSLVSLLGFFMTIQDQIEADLKDAMKAKQAERLSVLRMAKSALMNATIEKYGAGGKLSDPEAVVVILYQVKQREASIAGFEKGGRPELADKERREMEMLGQYLPKALSEAETKPLVQEPIKEANATSKAPLGHVMKIATERAAGRVDGKTLSQHVRDALP